MRAVQTSPGGWDVIEYNDDDEAVKTTRVRVIATKAHCIVDNTDTCEHAKMVQALING